MGTRDRIEVRTKGEYIDPREWVRCGGCPQIHPMQGDGDWLLSQETLNGRWGEEENDKFGGRGAWLSIGELKQEHQRGVRGGGSITMLTGKEVAWVEGD